MGFAADGASRINGKPGFVCVTYGAGGLNLVNPVANAFSEKCPVIILSGAPPDAFNGLKIQLHHQINGFRTQMEIFKKITCDQAILNEPEKTPEILSRVFSNCINKSRPVYLELPKDKIFSPVPNQKLQITQAYYDHEAVDFCALEILKKIEHSKNPLLVLGIEIKRFSVEEKVWDFAKKCGLRTITTFLAKGTCFEKGAIQSYLGGLNQPELEKEIKSSDCLILLGTVVSDTNFLFNDNFVDPTRQILIQNQKVVINFHEYMNIPLYKLMDALRQTNYFKKPRSINPIKNKKSPPSHWISESLNFFLEKDEKHCLICDVGDALFIGSQVKIKNFLGSGFYVSMGFSVPAAFGVAQRSNLRPIILLGDGAFQMTGWELLHCQRYGINPIVILINNQGWEMLRKFDKNTEYLDLPNLNYKKLGEIFAAKSFSVKKSAEFFEVLKSAFKEPDQFYFIEVVQQKGEGSRFLTNYIESLSANVT